ncbi:MAG: formylglycine-generating enzyme family protein [Bacteroidales bacterium]|nr:formylglycine-generating enzyme family protein [Bacteroidales bacterium]
MKKNLLLCLSFLLAAQITGQQKHLNQEIIPFTNFTLRIQDELHQSLSYGSFSDKDKAVSDKVHFTIANDPDFRKSSLYQVVIKNTSPDTLRISNFVPFGENENHVYITATGPWALARAKLFRPGFGPVNVTLPDNAWELGYASFPIDEGSSVCALARRIGWTKAQRRRYETIVEPGGDVTYSVYLNTFEGEWQNGLKKMFQEHYLFDLDTFDLALYERKDLAWIRSAYLMVLQFAWNHEFYDWQTQKYKIDDFLKNPKHFGWYDVFGIWPTWPRLGVDERNQWDLYGDLPGGLPKLRDISSTAASLNTRFFIAFNPWDQSTRFENPYVGMARLIDELNADGVVLDTQGSSSDQLQRAADSIKPGVIMYSEGMAVVKDMPGIISGRVHDAIFLQPVLNLNKLIKPDFAIFRVCQLSQGRIHRETAISFFNGYGTEINTFAPGRPDWMDEEYSLLGRTTMILRENTDAFNSYEFTPMINSTVDSIWINQFQTAEKTIYTILSLKHNGHHGHLFKVDINEKHHFINLWNHEEVTPQKEGGSSYIPVSIPPFKPEFTGTRREGQIDCIAGFPRLIALVQQGDSLILTAGRGEMFKLWKGNPSYEIEPVVFNLVNLNIRLSEYFGRYEGKIVIQLFDAGLLADECVIARETGEPLLISEFRRTGFNPKIASEMVLIPDGKFAFYSTNNDQFIPYPSNSDSSIVRVKSFYMDKFPISNRQYFDFVRKSGYLPKDTMNYLKHWINGKYLPEDADKPVTWVDLNDANAYATWIGKRLPTEAEWQYAAQGLDGRKWPWGNDPDSTKCNTGTGMLLRSDAWPEGFSPFGVHDLVGNVWQLTNDVYDNGSYSFVMIRGGSYFNPTSSWWYVKGGPQTLDSRQMLLLVGPGFDRNATVGFRCVMDK